MFHNGLSCYLRSRPATIEIYKVTRNKRDSYTPCWAILSSWPLSADVQTMEVLQSELEQDVL